MDSEKPKKETIKTGPKETPRVKTDAGKTGPKEVARVKNETPKAKTDTQKPKAE